MSRYCPTIDADDDILVVMYFGDLPIKTIGKRLGVCNSTVHWRLHANGMFVNRVPKSGWSEIDDAKILYARYNGGTCTDFEGCVQGRKYDAIKDRLRRLIRGGHNAY